MEEGEAVRAGAAPARPAPAAPAAPADLPRTLIVSNDFPPRVGGVQQYVWNLVANLPPDRVAVLAPNWTGWRDHDARQPFPVHRWPAQFLWPTADLSARVRSLARGHEAEVILYGHGFPTPLVEMGGGTGLPYVVLTHGAEVWLARTPGVAGAMRRVLAGASSVTAVSGWTAGAIGRALPPWMPVTVVPPGVDERRFRPDVDGSAVRERHGLAGGPVVLCVSRLVRRKGQDRLIAAMPIVRRVVPEAALLLVGDGSDRARLEAMAADLPRGMVTFAGEVREEDLPAYHAAGDVFAMPCRSRWAGLEVEGFGIVYLEAAATGKPVVAGRSGGAAEAVEDGRTGMLVEGGEPKAVAMAIISLLGSPDVAARMGGAGRVRVERSFTWTHQSSRVAQLLRDAAGDHGPGFRPRRPPGGAGPSGPTSTPGPRSR